MFFIVLSALLLATATEHLFAGGQDKKNADDEKIEYVELGSDQGIYNATIQDGKTEIPITKLSFAGETTLDGIKKERDNSTCKISLGEVSRIVIIDPLYISTRYPHIELCCALVTTTSGVTEELLMPRNILICGQDRESKIRKAWPLRKISSIMLEHAPTKKASRTQAHYVTVPALLTEPAI